MSPTIDIPSPSISTPRVSPIKVSVTRETNGKQRRGSSPKQVQIYEQTNIGSEKAVKVQGQVNEVIGIMQNNIEKVVQRGENLSSLQNKTDELNQGALQFKKGTTLIKNEMWWKNASWLLLSGVLQLV
ncbi:hypothetical protein BASA62_009392 [Batrachochytrium salamandrivorans]|nr:hypothetical protein BASA62_009392 [Batrachochytrium salamandrivorans]